VESCRFRDAARRLRRRGRRRGWRRGRKRRWKRRLARDQPLSFSADHNGAVPAAKTFTATFSEPTVAFFVVGVPAGSTLPPWLNAPTITGASSPITVTITPNTTAMVPGVHSTTIRMVTATASQAIISLRDASVTYTINGVISASPTSLNFDEQIGVSTPAAQNVTLSDTGNTNYAWTASISYQSGAGWLLLNGTSNAGGQTVPPGILSVSVSGAALQPGTYQATIQISGNGRTVNVPVTYVRRAPQVNFVAPYVGLTNTAGQAIIRGNGFNAITAQKVKFGVGTDATTQTVVNDTEIRANYPALPAGTYPVFVENATGNQYTRANLVIVDAPTFPDVAIARTGGSLDLIYDAERRAIYIASSNGAIDRYRFNGSTWNADSLPLADLRGFALTPDGKEIVAITSQAPSQNAVQSVVHIDAATFTVTATVDGPVPHNLRFLFDLTSIAMANNGVAIIASGSPTTSGSADPVYAYDTLSRTSTSLAFDIFGFQDGVVAAAGDGSRVIAVGQGGSPPAKTHYYDATTGSFNGTSLFLNGSFVLVNKNASKFLHGFTSVYDSSFALLGDLPGPDPGSCCYNTPAFSPLGDFVYTYSSFSTLIRKFDLASPDGSGGFNQVGGATPPFSPLAGGQAMRVSFDGGKLFIADNAKLVVQAAP